MDSTQKIASIETQLDALYSAIQRLAGTKGQGPKALKALVRAAESNAGKGRDTFFRSLSRGHQNNLIEDDLWVEAEAYLSYMNKAAECFINEDYEGYNDFLSDADHFMKTTLRGLS